MNGALMPRRVASSACPYCPAVLDPPPGHQQRYPKCKEMIFIRDFGDRPLLVTQERAGAVDQNQSTN